MSFWTKFKTNKTGRLNGNLQNRSAFFIILTVALSTDLKTIALGTISH